MAPMRRLVPPPGLCSPCRLEGQQSMGQRHAGTIFRILRKSGTEVKGCVQYFPGCKSGTAVRLQGGQEDSGLEIGPEERPACTGCACSCASFHQSMHRAVRLGQRGSDKSRAFIICLTAVLQGALKVQVRPLGSGQTLQRGSAGRTVTWSLALHPSGSGTERGA